MINPYRRIRDLEREKEYVELARVKAEDECRALHAQLATAREAEAVARREAADVRNKFEDWMAGMMRQQPIHGAPKPLAEAPPPTRRPTSHGAAIEAELISQYEKDLGIATPN